MNLEQVIASDNLIKDKLKESEERFSLAMKGANDGLWDWNLLTDEVYYSPGWKSMLGYKDVELQNHFSTWEQLVHDDDKKNILKKAQDCIEGQDEEFEVEMRMYHKDGSVVIVLSRAFVVRRESDNKAIRLVGTHVDITQRKKSEDFVKKTNEILKMIAIGKPASDVYDAIALMYEARHTGLRCSLLELEDGKLLHGGAPSMPREYCEAVHGLKIGPEVGSCGTSTFSGKRVLVENIETDSKWANIKQYALPHGMRCCWSEPIIDSTGKVLGAFGMYYDYPSLPNDEESEDLLSAARLSSIVMERDQSHKRMQKDQKIISEQTKLASMGEMIVNIAHQWRQPLSIISTASTGAKLKKELNLLGDKEFIEIMNTINDSVQYLSQTIEDFRGFFDPKNNKLKKFLLSEMILKTLKLSGSQFIDKKIRVIQTVENVSIVSLENELIQVLVNLLNNSRDALLTLENEKRFIFINVYEKDEELYIEVKDNAGGIPEDIIDRIFEPYFTTKYQSQGTGIGLYMSQDIVRSLLKGTITVFNSVYQYNEKMYRGASFVIKLKQTL